MVVHNINLPISLNAGKSLISKICSYLNFCIISGAVHLNDCPVEPSIPIFLIVGGSFSVLKYILNLGTGRLILFYVDIDQAHTSRELQQAKFKIKQNNFDQGLQICHLIRNWLVVTTVIAAQRVLNISQYNLSGVT